MAELPTVRIHSERPGVPFVTINEHEYRPGKHRLYEEDVSHETAEQPEPPRRQSPQRRTPKGG